MKVIAGLVHAVHAVTDRAQDAIEALALGLDGLLHLGSAWVRMRAKTSLASFLNMH